MKRIAFLLVVSLLIGCGGGGSSDPGTNNQLPIVTTTPSSNITVNSATANGSVNPNGNATNAYFEWGTDSTLATHTDTTTQSVGSGVASVSVNTALTGLSAGTTYYYRICAVSSTGESTGSIASFTTGTPAAKPTVQTQAATGIALAGATLNGQVNPNGVPTSGRFRWGYSLTTLPNLTPWVDLGAGATSVSISFNLTGQSPGTPIYYQAEGDSSAGNTLGEVVTFTTLVPSLPPTVTTFGATNISQTGGTLNGQVNPNGVASSGRFRWGYSSTTLTNLTPWVDLGAGATDISISFNLTGQTPTTTIYYQAEGDSFAGNALGGVANFTTLAVSAPTATTEPATNITDNSATLNGTVTPNGLETTAWFEWSTDPTFSNVWSNLPHQSVGSGTTSQPVSYNIPPPLTTGVTFYFRILASNSSGTTYGSPQSFITGN